MKFSYAFSSISDRSIERQVYQSLGYILIGPDLFGSGLMIWVSDMRALCQILGPGAFREQVFHRTLSALIPGSADVTEAWTPVISDWEQV